MQIHPLIGGFIAVIALVVLAYILAYMVLVVYYTASRVVNFTLNRVIDCHIKWFGE